MEEPADRVSAPATGQHGEHDNPAGDHTMHSAHEHAGHGPVLAESLPEASPAHEPGAHDHGAAGEQNGTASPAATAHEHAPETAQEVMGHGGHGAGASMDEMVRDMRNRFLVAERESEHPLAKAIVAYAEQRGARRVSAESFRNITGQGAVSTVEGHRVLLGNTRLMDAEGVDSSAVSEQQQALAGTGRTAIIVAVDGTAAGIIALADAPRDTAAAAITAMHEMGVEVVMLTGDNMPTATRIGQQLGIDTIIAEVLPEDKSAKIAELQKAGKKVAMVGDGVNDAPALAQADLGIAIGAGTDVAIETADVVLMRSDPLDVPIALRIGKGTVRKMRQNLGWAIGYNAVALPIAAGVFYPAFGLMLSPEIAAISMSGSSVIVAVNALLLTRLRLPAAPTPASPARPSPEPVTPAPSGAITE